MRIDDPDAMKKYGIKLDTGPQVTRQRTASMPAEMAEALYLLVERAGVVETTRILQRIPAIIEAARDVVEDFEDGSAGYPEQGGWEHRVDAVRDSIAALKAALG